jgi:hypothetical protein
MLHALRAERLVRVRSGKWSLITEGRKAVEIGRTPVPNENGTPN